jgi:hypothetical protein
MRIQINNYIAEDSSSLALSLIRDDDPLVARCDKVNKAVLL